MNEDIGKGFDARTKDMKREKYLVFQLYQECFGIPLSTVKEVIGLTDITSIPQVPGYFRGLINLRGQIISVLDLRVKLNLPKADDNGKKTCIIIVEIKDLVLGAVVDDVQQVAGFMNDQIEDGIDMKSSINKEFITGVARTDSRRLIILLDIGKVLDAEDLLVLRQQHKKAA